MCVCVCGVCAFPCSVEGLVGSHAWVSWGDGAFVNHFWAGSTAGVASSRVAGYAGSTLPCGHAALHLSLRCTPALLAHWSGTMQCRTVCGVPTLQCHVDADHVWGLRSYHCTTVNPPVIVTTHCEPSFRGGLATLSCVVLRAPTKCGCISHYVWAVQSPVTWRVLWRDQMYWLHRSRTAPAVFPSFITVSVG